MRRRRSPGGRWRCCSRSRACGRGSRSRPAWPSSAVTRIYLTHDVVLGARESVRDVARNLERFVDGDRRPDRSARGRRRARGPGGDPGHQRADPARASLPGAGRRVHDAASGSAASTGSSSPSSATATTSTTRSPCSAPRSGWRSGSPIRPATRPNERIVARAQELAAAVRRPARRSATTRVEAVRGAAVVYTDAWTSMGQEAETEERRDAFAGLPGRRRAARRGRSRRARDALPAGPSRRGDHVRGDGRTA